MKLQNLGAHKNVIHLENGTSVLVSYETPVAALIPGLGYVQTDKKWSVTTSKHITQWVGRRWDAPINTRPQSFFDNLLG